MKKFTINHDKSSIVAGNIRSEYHKKKGVTVDHMGTILSFFPSNAVRSDSSLLSRHKRRVFNVALKFISET